MFKRKSMPPLLSLRTSFSRASSSSRHSEDYGTLKSEPDLTVGVERDRDVDIEVEVGVEAEAEAVPTIEAEVENFTGDGRSAELMAYYMPSPVSRPLSMVSPQPFEVQGPYCPRRPTLADILANKSPPPWTLSAFIAYLSQNHCLETLEFTMDADRYRKHYSKMAARSLGGEIGPGSDESIYVQGLWHRLMQAHIAPNGAREVNLPSDVRDALLSQNDPLLPPHPDALNEAVQKVYELMEESVLVPFYNSFYPQAVHPGSTGSSTEDLTFLTHSFDERGLFRSQTNSTSSRRHQLRRASPNGTPLSTSTPNSSHLHVMSSSTAQHRASAPSSFSQFARSISHSARHGFPNNNHSNHNISTNVSTMNNFSFNYNNTQPSPPRVLSAHYPQHTSLISSGSSNALSSHSLTPATSTDIPANNGAEDGSIPPPPMLTEDNASSPSALGDPTTPPNTPPMVDFGSPVTSAGPNSTVNNGSKSPGNPWKRMRYSFGWKRKSEQNQAHQQHSLQQQQQQQTQYLQQQQQTHVDFVPGNTTPAAISTHPHHTTNFASISGVL